MLFIVDHEDYEVRIRYHVLGYFAVIKPQYHHIGSNSIFIWGICGRFYVRRYIRWVYGFGPMRSISLRLSIKDIASDAFYKYCCEIEQIGMQLHTLHTRQDMIAREMHSQYDS